MHFRIFRMIVTHNVRCTKFVYNATPDPLADLRETQLLRWREGRGKGRWEEGRGARPPLCKFLDPPLTACWTVQVTAMLHCSSCTGRALVWKTLKCQWIWQLLGKYQVKTVSWTTSVHHRLFQPFKWFFCLQGHIEHFFSGSIVCLCLQCFDAVGWATGRASGL